MTEQEKRKGGGGKLSRSETVTVRLDPKLRYLAEIAALKQRRTLSSFIEWAINDALDRVTLEEGPDWVSSVGAKGSELWDVDEPDRFAKLAIRYPDLLTHDEQILWKLIRENGYLWKGKHAASSGRWIWDINEPSLCFDRLRDQWEAFNSVAKGQAGRDTLPKWKEVDESKKQRLKPSFDDLGDDIPF